ncbi:MAG: TRAP transporter small permease subunit [Gammaproteobacteria bacterium]
MLDWLSKFLVFVGAVAEYCWRSYTEGTQHFLRIVQEAPLSRGYEIVFLAFLASVCLVFIAGVLSSLIRWSPRPFILTVERWVRFFGHAGAWVIIILIAAMVYEVVSRYFFGSPTRWAFEVAYMLMGTSFMLGIAYCLQLRRHVRVDFVYDHVGPRVRAVIDLLGFVLLIPMLLWLAGGLWEYFQDAYDVDETSGESAWNPIIWPFKYTFVMGFVLLLAQCTVEILKCFMVLGGAEVPEPPSPELERSEQTPGEALF